MEHQDKLCVLPVSNILRSNFKVAQRYNLKVNREGNQSCLFHGMFMDSFD